MNEFLNIHKKLKNVFEKHEGSDIDIKEWFLYSLEKEQLFRLSLAIKHQNILEDSDANIMTNIIKLYASNIKGFDADNMDRFQAEEVLTDFQNGVLAVLCIRCGWAIITDINGSQWEMELTEKGNKKITRHERIRKEMKNNLGLK